NVGYDEINEACVTITGLITTGLRSEGLTKKKEVTHTIKRWLRLRSFIEVAYGASAY
ncbi:10293_t:CDS:2, partial [Funneliformis caledonium]